MANVGTAPAGRTLIGQGTTTSPSFKLIGTDSGLTAHGVLVSEGNSPFVSVTPGGIGTVLMSNGVGADPSFQSGGTVFGQTITGNTGGAQSPIAGNWTIVTANSTPKFAGAAATLTLDFNLSNLALGSSMTAVTSAANNVAMGGGNLGTLTTGASNTSIGALSMQSVIGGNNNTCVGYQTGKAITSAISNCLFGANAGSAITTGAANCAFGRDALASFTAGAGNAGSNIGIGLNALATLVTGLRNIAIGSTAGSNYTTSESDNILIHNTGVVGESNTIRIGTNVGAQGAQTSAYIQGIYAVTVASSLPVTIDTNGQLGTSPGGGSAWVEVTGTSQSAAVGFGYIANNAGLVTITLPASFAVGDYIKIQGSGAGGWSLVANTGDTIQFLSTPTSAAGSLSSTNRYDAVEVIGIVANTTWVARNVTGNLTVA